MLDTLLNLMKTEFSDLSAKKQDKLTSGENVEINGSEISVPTDWVKEYAYSSKILTTKEVT